MNMRIPALTFAALTALTMAASPAFALSNDSQQRPDTTNNDSDQPVTDTWITTKVKTELATTDGVKSMDIEVTTVDGVVTLVGVLGSDTAVKKAVAAAQSIKGVKRVDASGLK